MKKTAIRFLSLAFALIAGHAHAMTPEETTLVTNAAERGSAGAQLMLAIEYLHGDGGLKQDPKQAAYWLERAGAQGNATAQLMLGDLYEQGNGVPTNLKLSADWWHRAANRGNTQAQLKLGKLYLSDKVIGKDAGKAEYWLNRAAVEGNAEAQFLLGRFYQQRNSSARDRELAGNLYAKAAENGYSLADDVVKYMKGAGYEVMESFHQHPVDLHKMAEDGDANAQYQLATRYESGYKEPQDYAKALHWFRQAADNGSVMAMKSLAHIYEKGLDGVKADPAMAAQWAKKAAASEH